MAKRFESLRDTVQRKNLLHDFYGELLTEKQNACFVLHYMEDWSLTEISEQFSITPQAVVDLLKRTGTLLDGYEEKLGLVEKHAEQTEAARQINNALDSLTIQHDDNERADLIASIRQLVEQMIS